MSLVWLPFEPALLGDPPPGLRYAVVDPTEDVPNDVAEVAFYVPPYQVGSRVAEVLGRMSSLQVVQTLTAGVDNIRDHVPSGVTLSAVGGGSTTPRRPSSRWPSSWRRCAACRTSCELTTATSGRPAGARRSPTSGP
jgi:hypothetical protein